MFTHVLVPLDGLPQAESALPAAAAVAARFNARVTLLHVLEPHPPAQLHGMPHLGDVNRANTYLDEVAGWLSARGVTVVPHVHAPAMGPVEGISGHAVELEANLIILCTHGGGGLRGLLFGRMAQRVAAASVVPVLAVPAMDHPRSQTFQLQPVVVPLDGSHQAEVALRSAVALSGPGGHIHLVRIIPTTESLAGTEAALTRLLPHATAALLDAEVRTAADYLIGVRDGLTGRGVEVDAIIGRGDAVRGVITAAHVVRGKLIVLVTHGLAGMAAVWAGSVGARLLQHTTLPVLLIHAEAVPEARRHIAVERSQ